MQNTIYETYIRLTDMDMEYDEYLIHCSTIAEPKPVNNKKVCRTHLSPKLIRLKLNLIYLNISRVFYEPTLKIQSDKYVRFTKEQKKYLKHMFKVNPLPNYDELLSNMIKFNIKNQLVTKKRIKIYFKNQRYQHRKN